MSETLRDYSAEADLAQSRVKFVKLPRRVERYGDGHYTPMEKSRSEIRIDGELVGYLVLPNGWGKCWEIEALAGAPQRRIKLFNSRPREFSHAAILEHYKEGKLPTQAQLDAIKADADERERFFRAEQEQRRQEREIAKARRRDSAQSAINELTAIANGGRPNEAIIPLQASHQYALAFAIGELQKIVDE